MYLKARTSSTHGSASCWCWCWCGCGCWWWCIMCGGGIARCGGIIIRCWWWWWWWCAAASHSASSSAGCIGNWRVCMRVWVWVWGDSVDESASVRPCPSNTSHSVYPHPSHHDLHTCTPYCCTSTQALTSFPATCRSNSSPHSCACASGLATCGGACACIGENNKLNKMGKSPLISRHHNQCMPIPPSSIGQAPTHLHPHGRAARHHRPPRAIQLVLVLVLPLPHQPLPFHVRRLHFGVVERPVCACLLWAFLRVQSAQPFSIVKQPIDQPTPAIKSPFFPPPQQLPRLPARLTGPAGAA
jgi:hypothetical protein